MASTLFAVIVSLAALANYVLFMTLPTAMMQWISFAAEMVLVAVAVLVLRVGIEPPKPGPRFLPVRFWSRIHLLTILEVMITVAIAIVMYWHLQS